MKAKYTVFVPIRVTPEQLAELERRAAMYHFPSIAAYIRFQAAGEPRR